MFDMFLDSSTSFAIIKQFYNILIHLELSTIE